MFAIFHRFPITNRKLQRTNNETPKTSSASKKTGYHLPPSRSHVILGTVEDLMAIRIDLLHGANFNDPAAFQYRSYQQLKTSCGCGCFRC